MKKTITAIVLAALLVVSLFVGCKKVEDNKVETTSSPSESETTTETSATIPTDAGKNESGTAMTKEATKEVLDKATAITRNNKNASIDLLIDTSVMLKSERGEAVGMIAMRVNGTLQTTEHASHLRMTIESDYLNGKTELDIIAIEDDGTITTYTKQNGSNFYTKTVTDKSRVEEATGNISSMLADMDSIEWDGVETDTAYVLTHTFSSEEYKNVFAAMSSIGMNLLNDDSADMSGTVFTYRINKADYMPLDLTADMSVPMQRLIPEGMEDGGVDACSMILTINSYGTVAEIDPPENVLENDDPTVLTPPVPEGNTEGNGAWKDMRIIIDDVEYTIGDPYAKFAENGWTCDLSEYGGPDAMIEPGAVVSYYETLKSEKYGTSIEDPEIGVMIANHSDTAKKLIDCSIEGIWIRNNIDAGNKESRIAFSLPCGLKQGMTKDEVIRIIGEPAQNNIDVSEVLDYTILTYMDSEYEKYLAATIYEREGVQEVELMEYR